MPLSAELTITLMGKLVKDLDIFTRINDDRGIVAGGTMTHRCTFGLALSYSIIPCSSNDYY